MKKIAIATALSMMFVGSAGAQDNDRSLMERLKKLEDAIERIIPSGAVLAYLGHETSAPDGWEICGRGEGDFPSLEGRFLVGTHHLDSVGLTTGSDEHDHGVNIRSTDERDGHFNVAPEGADNQTGAPNWSHRHHVSGQTSRGTSIPPAVQVLFFCKQ